MRGRLLCRFPVSGHSEAEAACKARGKSLGVSVTVFVCISMLLNVFARGKSCRRRRIAKRSRRERAVCPNGHRGAGTAVLKEAVRDSKDQLLYNVGLIC